MDSIFPFVVICLLPLLALALAFILGVHIGRLKERGYRIGIFKPQSTYHPSTAERNGYSDHYKDFEEV